MIVTKRCISRRMMLRGVGASLALPFLDAMVPAFAAVRQTAAKRRPRMGAFYVPNGIIMGSWTPAETGPLQLPPTLEALRPIQDKVLVLSGLTNHVAYGRPGEGVGDHARASGTFLTGSHIKKTEGADTLAATSVDQLVAKRYENETPLASLELSLDSKELVGACDPGYSCAYSQTISWRTPTTPLPMENDPRVVFERLFGSSGSTDPAVRLERMRTERSLLDSVGEEVIRLQGALGTADRAKIVEYLDAVRDVERRIVLAEKQSGDLPLPVLEQPAGVPESFDEHAKLMFDLAALAFQTDMSRVITFMFAREFSSRSYPEIGVPEGHHALSHNIVDPEAVQNQVKINGYHIGLFGYFAQQLASMQDGDGSVLDQSILVYGSGISNGNTHAHDDLPIVAVGGLFKGGRHLRFAKDTPLSNLHATVVDKMNVPAERVGESTGLLEGLSDV